MGLTKRQKSILYAIVTEFIQTAEPVSSLLICQKYGIEVSPATIRYEMVRLTDEGFIIKYYSSSGRIPTELGYRVYIDELMDEEELHHMTEINLKKKLSYVRYHKEKMMKAIANVVADLSKYVGIVFTEEKLIHSGLHYLVDYPEFVDNFLVFKDMLMVFDDVSLLSSVLKGHSDNTVKVLIGSELNMEFLSNCSVVFTKLNLYGDHETIVACVGPKRMRFSRVIPLIRTVKDLSVNLTMGL